LHLPRTFFVVATRIHAEDATNVITVAGYTELAEGEPPFVQELTNRLADFVLAVLGMMPSAADGVDGSARGAVVK